MPLGDFIPVPLPSGWLCPRCNAVNGPHIAQCFCRDVSLVITGTGAPPPEPPVSILSGEPHELAR